MKFTGSIKADMQTDIDEYLRIHDRLPQKGVHPGHVICLNFGK